MNSKRREYCLGIDYGTSNSCAAICLNSQIIVVPNSIGERTTPSIVYFLDGKIYVGEEILNQKIEGNNLISEVKRFIGLDYNEFKETDFAKKLNYDVIEKDGKPLIKVMLNGKEIYYSPEEITSEIFKKMVRIVEDYISEKEEGIKIKRAIITVPVNFNSVQIGAIKSAAKLAGIEVIRTINEPASAALAYKLGDDLIPKNKSSNINNDSAPLANELFKTEENVLVFDLGGGTFDLTLLNIQKNNDGLVNFEPISKKGYAHLGGIDFDNKIRDYCIKDFCNIYGYDEECIKKDKKACRKLSIKCEEAKKILSTSDEADINILDFYGGEILSEKITNTLFERLCKDLFAKIRKKIIDLLKEEKKEPYYYIDAVILIGGATRMVGIKKMLKSIFGDEKKIKDNIDPDEAVAKGATRLAMKLENKNKVDFILQDIIPYNLGINTINNKIVGPQEIQNGDLMTPIIYKNSKIPCESVGKFKIILTKNCRDINIDIIEGNNKYAKKNKKLGVITKKGIKQLGEFEIQIKFKVDVDSKLTVSLNIQSLGISINLEIKGVTNAFKDDINKKIIINKSRTVGPINPIIKDIDSIKESISKSEKSGDLDDEDRIYYLIECSNKYEELINSYIKFEKINNYAIEKVYLNIKELFHIYIKRLNFINGNKNNNAKDDVKEIIKKIKEGMKNVISVIGYVSDLLNIFIEFNESNKYEKDESKKENNRIIFYEIFLNYMELMYEEGLNRINKKKKREIFFQIIF